MVNQIIQQYVKHPKRAWISSGFSLAIGLLFVLPAWDDLSAARAESAALQSELENTTQEVSNHELMQVKLRELAVDPATHQMIDTEKADEIREEVTRMVHELDCQMRRLTLSDPIRRDWLDGDDPFASSTPEGAAPTDFNLETRTLNVSVDGSLAQISRFTIALNRLSRFAVPIEMTLQRERENGELRLDVDISLLNLIKTND
ncbi:MAG: hypothetical protein WBD20_16165 [Pirellulaceae bacterium]